MCSLEFGFYRYLSDWTALSILEASDTRSNALRHGVGGDIYGGPQEGGWSKHECYTYQQYPCILVLISRTAVESLQRNDANYNHLQTTQYNLVILSYISFMTLPCMNVSQVGEMDGKVQRLTNFYKLEVKPTVIFAQHWAKLCYEPSEQMYAKNLSFQQPRTVLSP